ncbi:MAG: hypothetical protein AB1728_07845 [Bacteroidota bacterium]
MKPVLLLAIILLVDACKVYRRIPENGIAYSKRYNFVFRSVLDVEDYFVNGRLKRSVAYHANGNIAIDMRSSGGNSDTMWTVYFHPNGQKMREMLSVFDTLRWENDWYDDGMQRLSFAHGANDRQTVRRWHANGIKSEESEWQGNMRHGKFIEWDLNGRRIRNEMYRNGVKIK